MNKKEIDELFDKLLETFKKEKDKPKDVLDNIDECLKVYKNDDKSNAILFITRSSMYVYGTGLEVGGLIYSTMKHIQDLIDKKEIRLELVIDAIIRGLTTNEDDINKINKEKLSKILDEIKKMI